MNNHKPRSGDPVRSIPSIVRRSPPDDGGEKTSVDVRRVAPVAFTTPVRRGPEPAPLTRPPKASNPPPNVIPFAKPRSIAAMAAANPASVAIQPAPVSVPASPPSYAPASRVAPVVPVSSYRSAAPAPAAPVATGYAAPVPVFTGSAAPKLEPLPMPAPVMAAPAPVSAPSMFASEEPTVYSPPPMAQPGDTWAVFEKLGLDRPKVTAQDAQRWVISAYRLLGFSILTIIVVVLVGYITTTAFFYVSDSWVVPMAVTPNDEKVVSLQAQLSTQQDQRDRIADELNQAERAIVAQQTFQAEFEKAIRGDLAARRATLEKWRNLASTAAGTRAAIQSQNAAYAGAARKRMKAEYAAGLIDRDGMLSGKFQLAQISSSNLSLAERQAEYETRAAELEATARSLDAILTNSDDDGEVGLSYEVLQIKQQYETSRLELAKAVEQRDSLKTSLARQDKIVQALERSAYLRAIDDQATVAFVPYGNLADVKKGEPLYKCKLTMVICFRVGEVLDVIPGEVQFRHPHRDKNLRGQLVEMKLDDDDADAAMEEHLFVGGKPFLL